MFVKFVKCEKITAPPYNMRKVMNYSLVINILSVSCTKSKTNIPIIPAYSIVVGVTNIRISAYAS